MTSLTSPYAAFASRRFVDDRTDRPISIRAIHARNWCRLAPPHFLRQLVPLHALADRRAHLPLERLGHLVERLAQPAESFVDRAPLGVLQAVGVAEIPHLVQAHADSLPQPPV